MSKLQKFSKEKYPETNMKVLGAASDYFRETFSGCCLICLHRTNYNELLVHDHNNKRLVKLRPQYNSYNSVIKLIPLLILLDHKEAAK